MCSNSECGELFEVPDTAVGRKVQCPACGAVQVISGPPEDSPLTGPGESDRPDEDKSLDVQLLALGPEAWPSDSPREKVPQGAEGQPKGEVDLTPVKKKPSSLAELAATKKPDQQEQPEAEVEVESVFSPIFDSRPVFLSSEAGGLPATAESGIEGTLANKWVTATILLVGLLGMVVGALLGAHFFRSQQIIATFTGGAVGWVVGFVFTFFLALGLEGEEPGKVRCRICRNLFSAGTVICKWCGSTVLTENINPLTTDCLAAGRYALSRLRSVYWLALLLMAGGLLFVGTSRLVEAFPAELTSWRPVLLGLCTLIAFLIFAYWLQYLLSVVNQTVMDFNEAPDLPDFWDLSNVVVGVKGLGVLAMYVLPLFTIPLLPVGLFRLAAPGRSNAFNLPQVIRTAWTQAKDFVILWLWLLLWCSVLIFAVAATEGLCRLGDLLPSVEGYSAEVLKVTISAVGLAIVGAAACISGLAMFRCIGIFGRYNAAALFDLAEAVEETDSADDEQQD